MPPLYIIMAICQGVSWSKLKKVGKIARLFVLANPHQRTVSPAKGNRTLCPTYCVELRMGVKPTISHMRLITTARNTSGPVRKRPQHKLPNCQRSVSRLPRAGYQSVSCCPLCFTPPLYIISSICQPPLYYIMRLFVIFFWYGICYAELT